MIHFISFTNGLCIYFCTTRNCLLLHSKNALWCLKSLKFSLKTISLTLSLTDSSLNWNWVYHLWGWCWWFLLFWSHLRFSILFFDIFHTRLNSTKVLCGTIFRSLKTSCFASKTCNIRFFFRFFWLRLISSVIFKHGISYRSFQIGQQSILFDFLWSCCRFVFSLGLD